MRPCSLHGKSRSKPDSMCGFGWEGGRGAEDMAGTVCGRVPCSYHHVQATALYSVKGSNNKKSRC